MRRGFTVVELTIGMAITAVLLTGLFAALQSSVDAYAKSSADGVNRLTSRLSCGAHCIARSNGVKLWAVTF